MHLLHLKPKEHSALSDGQGLPEEYCDYGRDMMALDFCSLSDHDSGFSHRGIFVTILGYEYLPRFSLYYCTGYYLNDDGPLMRGEDELYAYEASHYSGKLITPQEICKTIRGKKALIIPHHTGHRGTGGYDWDYHDGELQRLVEIYSKFGSSEYPNSLKPLGTQAANRFVQNALERGYRLGFTGGSDTHVGRPGSDGFDAASLQYRSGLTAVYAEDLTREAIWDALWNRRCYATTGERIILDVKINGNIMGSENPVNSNRVNQDRKIQVKVSGTSKIEKIDVVRNNANIYTQKEDKGDVNFEYVDRDDPEEIALHPRSPHQPPFIFYYVRVTQEDSEMAWSSPIWFELKH